MNRDIRAFFQKPSGNTSSIAIEKKAIDTTNDIREIKPKTKEKKPKQQNPLKSKVKVDEETSFVKASEKSPKKKKKEINNKTDSKKVITLESADTPISKTNNKLIRQRKKIIDDDDDQDVEINDLTIDNIEPPNNEREQIVQSPPIIHQKQVIKTIQKKEKVIDIGVDDFFNMSKDDAKNKFKELENQAKKVEKDEDVEMKDINEQPRSNKAIPLKNNGTSKDDKMIVEDKEDNANDNDPFLDVNIDELAKEMFDTDEDIGKTEHVINTHDNLPKDAPHNLSHILNNRTIIQKSFNPKDEGNKGNSMPPLNNKGTVVSKPNIKPTHNREKEVIPLYQLWSEKYKPKTQLEIIGNGTAVNQLSEWLNNWEDVVLNGNKRDIQSSFGKGRKTLENINAKAAIVSGSPGIGKTSTVRLLASIKNYRTFELNASDQRNKEVINNSVGFLMNNKTLTADKEITKRNLIIMDEVDGMGGNQDKGGIAALINIVKKTKVPIIFICNDIYSQKLKSLINHCYDIRFSKPDKRQVVNRLYTICQQEKLKIDLNTLDFLCGGFNSDIRQCLNFLELSSKGNVNDIKEKSTKFKKDDGVVINSFEGCKRLLNKAESSKMNVSERMDLFYIDYDLQPLLIHENYLTCYGNYNNKSDLDKIAEVSQSLSFSDILDTRIRYKNDWSLLPDKGIHSAIVPSTVNGGSLGFPKFPELYSKMSKISKLKRQVKEIRLLFPHTSLNAIKHEIAPLLFSIITNSLVTNGKNGIETIISLFSKSKFSLSQIKDSLFDLQSEKLLLNYTKLNTGIKSALTKRLNEQSNLNIFNKKATKKDKTVIQPQIIRRDIDGNLIEEMDQQSNDAENSEIDDEDTSSIFEPIPKAKNSKKKNAK